MADVRTLEAVWIVLTAGSAAGLLSVSLLLLLTFWRVTFLRPLAFLLLAVFWEVCCAEYAAYFNAPAGLTAANLEGRVLGRAVECLAVWAVVVWVLLARAPKSEARHG